MDDTPSATWTRGINALLPGEIARKAETIGAQKARMDSASLIVLAILAGAFIGLGAMFATTVLAGAEGVLPFGVSRLIAGAVFCLGLILVVVGGAELFTGNTLMVMALGAGKVRLGEVLRAWLIVYFGNFVGAAGTAPRPCGTVGKTHVTLGQNAPPLTSVFFVLQQRICRDVPPHPDRNGWIGALCPSGGAWGQSGARRGREGLVPDRE